MFFLRIFCVELITLSIYNLITYFRVCGGPAGGVDFLRSPVMVSVLVIVASLLLQIPKPINRNLGLGVFYVLILTAIYYQFAWFAVGREDFTAPNFLIGLVQNHRAHFAQLLENRNLAIATLATAWVLLVLPAAILNTPDVKFFFDVSEDRWFGKSLVYKKFDFKPWICAALVAVLMNLDVVLPARSSSAACGSETREGGKAASAAAPPPRVNHVDPNQRRWDEDKERAGYAAFAQNDGALWVVLSVGKLLHYDLKTYRSQIFDFVAYSQGVEDFLSTDGKFFYAPLNRQIFSTDTGAAVSRIPVFSPERVFLGFAKGNTYLVYIKAQHVVQWLSAESGAKSLEIPMSLTLGHDDVDWSPDRSLMFFRISDVAFQFVNTASGKSQVQNAGFRKAENVFDDVKQGAVIVNGPVGFNKEYKTYKIDLATLGAQEIAYTKKLLGLDASGQYYLAGERGSYQVIDKTTFQDEIPLKMDFRKLAVIPGFNSFAIVEDAAPELKLFDLKTGVRTRLAGPFSTGRSVDDNNCVLASSRDGQLLFTSCWKQAEVFWVSTLAGPKVQSWKFNLNFEPPPSASPAPAPKASAGVTTTTPPTTMLPPKAE